LLSPRFLVTAYHLIHPFIGVFVHAAENFRASSASRVNQGKCPMATSLRQKWHAMQFSDNA
jgi:hypothetical protein